MIDLMVFGHPDDPSGCQYDIYDAAAAVGYRRKAARDLQASPLFQGVYMKALAALRNGEFAKSIKPIAEIRPACHVFRDSSRVLTGGADWRPQTTARIFERTR
jgi:hypothetical protein